MCSKAVGSRALAGASGLLLALALATSGCGARYVNHGTDLYQSGRYVEAAEVFERTEERLAQSTPSERARFGLYRGATFLKLGDAPHAARWLGYARGIAKQDPDALGRDDLRLLGASLEALGHVRTAAPAAAGTAVATAPSPLGDLAPAE